MTNFFLNFFIVLSAFSSWYLIGLGPALVLLPNFRKHYAFFLSPLIGMSLIVLVSLFQLTVLLIPLYPLLNTIGLLFLSLVLCIWTNRYISLDKVWDIFRKHLFYQISPCLFLILGIAWLFHTSGFHMLVGSSDPLQYSLDARQILNLMNTGLPDDLPVPRYDHIVYDIATRLLPYFISYRRGAEVLLANLVSLTGLGFEEAFPVLILSALATLSLSLVFLGRVFLYISKFSCLILQITFVSSFYLLLLHIQGSLAMLCGMALGLLSLPFVYQTLRSPSWRWVALTVIVVAGYFSIYAEPAMINVLLPSILLILWQIYRTRWKDLGALVRLGSAYLLVGICAYFAIFSVVENGIFNFWVALSGYLHTLTQTGTSHISVQNNFFTSSLSTWNLAAVVLGAISYYDPSSFNAKLGTILVNQPWFPLIGFFILSLAGFLGYIKSKNPLVRLMCLPLVIWSLASIFLAHAQDYLRFARSLHYTMPFAFIGLVMLASKCHLRKGDRFYAHWLIATWSGRLLLFTFLSLNFYSVIRTINYLTHVGYADDHIILRFNQRDSEWRSLNKELKFSSQFNAPILISGYQETIRPLAIVSNIDDQAHVLGSSILSFWPLYNMHAKFKWSAYNTRLSKEQLEAAQKKEDPNWVGHRNLELVKKSIQATVPVGGEFPKEWNQYKDVYQHRMKSFPNICDVIYKNEFSIYLPKEITSNLKNDVKGPYRVLLKSGPIKIKNYNDNKVQLLKLIYNGNLGDVALQTSRQKYQGKQVNKDKITIEVKIPPENLKSLNIIVKRPVILRSISLSPSSS